jgi:hypothetical protein
MTAVQGLAGPRDAPDLGAFDTRLRGTSEHTWHSALCLPILSTRASRMGPKGAS